MRDVCHRMIADLASRDQRVVFIGSDLSPGLLQDMREKHPHRHFMEGVTEQNVVGMAVGMALDGMVVFVNTISTFLTRRALEQIVVGCCQHNVPVRLVGNGGGLVYAPLGPTHISFDDVALMRVLPRMTIVAPLNDHEMRAFMRTSLDHEGPIYIRLSRSWEGRVKLPDKFHIGRAVVLEHAPYHDVGPVLIVSTGVASGRALEAAHILEAQSHILSTVLHVPTIKPFDYTMLMACASDARLIVVIEEHSVIGGLGSAVLEAAHVHLARIPRIVRIGISDVFPGGYGSQEIQMALFGLQPHQIAETVRGALS